MANRTHGRMWHEAGHPVPSGTARPLSEKERMFYDDLGSAILAAKRRRPGHGVVRGGKERGMSDGDDGMRYGPGERGPEDQMAGGDAIREEGAGRGSFDPSPYMRQLRGRGGQGQEYLDVKWRLVWLRREHPDAEIVTEHVRID